MDANSINKGHSSIKKLALITDAWFPQINGVVTTLSSLVKELQSQGIQVEVIQPNDYPNFPLPTYREIRLVWKFSGLKSRLQAFAPDAIHIATEGPLGWYVRRLALVLELPFTTAYHTRYPEYLRARLPVPVSWTYALFKRFHKPARHTLVPAKSIMQELENKGFTHLTLMSRGVDSQVFNPSAAAESQVFEKLEKPILLYVGRLAPEKNIQAFLQSSVAGTKVLIGSGPAEDDLQQTYPAAVFLGAKKGKELAAHYAQADVFVFPSITDTFGVVNIEAIACGTPVAAFNTTGPKDIISHGINGYLADDLNEAIQQALLIERDNIHLSIPQFTWTHAAQQFLQALALIENKNGLRNN